MIEASDPRPPVKRMRRLEVRRWSLLDPPTAAARAGSDGGDGHSDGDGFGGGDRRDSVVTICAECDRFLYNMMRLISGTLVQVSACSSHQLEALPPWMPTVLPCVQVGLGRLSPDDISTLLAAKGRPAVRNSCGLEVFKAPAQGLCLERCYYANAEEWMAPAGPTVAELSPRTAPPAAADATVESHNDCGDRTEVQEVAGAISTVEIG